jgi:hypothetical protein
MRRASTGRARRSVGILLGVFLTALPGRSQEVGYNGSIQFATGSYFFTERTDSFYLLNGMDLSAGRLYLQASVPVVVQNPPWISYGPTPLPSGGSESDRVREQLGGGRMGAGQGGQGGQEGSVIVLPTDGLAYGAGLADPIVSANIQVFADDTGTLDLRMGGGVKLPVASPTDGFGTGEWDYSGGLSLGARATDRDTVFADLSFQVLGDMPDLPFRNAVAYSLAYGRTISPNRWSLLASVYGMSRVLDEAAAPAQLGLGLTRFFDQGNSMTVDVSAGLSETVPDLSVSIGWRFGLTR